MSLELALTALQVFGAPGEYEAAKAEFDNLTKKVQRVGKLLSDSRSISDTLAGAIELNVEWKYSVARYNSELAETTSEIKGNVFKKVQRLEEEKMILLYAVKEFLSGMITKADLQNQVSNSSETPKGSKSDDEKYRALKAYAPLRDGETQL